MTPDELRTTYLARQSEFARAAKNMKEAVELLIANAGIQTLAIVSRVKEIDSFLEKCSRKSYTKPFEENTDFVGLRVIAYLPTDVDRILEVLRHSLTIVESQDKAVGLAPNQFGYRSHHLIAKVPTAWTQAPNYSGLGAVPVEIQVRTLLMHAWAEIEHKLQYKTADQVPRELQRRLFMLSAKVEEADEQFQSLVQEVQSYRKVISEKASKSGVFDTSVELNLDVFKEFLAFKYPKLDEDDKIAQYLYQSVVENGLSLKAIAEAAEKFSPLEKQVLLLVGSKLSRAGVLGYALEVFIPSFRKRPIPSGSRKRIINKLIEQAKNDG